MEMEKLLVLFAGLPSPPPLMLTLPVTNPDAFDATFRKIEMPAMPTPGLRASERVQVRVATVQVQPGPATIDAAVRAGGRVATTVTVPVDVVFPTL